MGESAFPAQTGLTGIAAFSGQHQDYKLSDDLARLCLPQEYKDSYRTLAWVNSICFLFLLIGLIGLKAPKVIIRPVVEVADIVPVVFTPPEEPPKAEPEPKPEETEEPKDTPEETPQVMTVVAAADPASVSFPVPVQGAVAIAPAAHLATPPPPPNIKPAPPPHPTQFNPNAAGAGSYPPPMYPGMAQRNHYEGTSTIEIMVDAGGTITSVKVLKSSGFPILDDAALNIVKTRWRFPPTGQQRWLQWACTFKLE